MPVHPFRNSIMASDYTQNLQLLAPAGEADQDEIFAVSPAEQERCGAEDCDYHLEPPS